MLFHSFEIGSKHMHKHYIYIYICVCECMCKSKLKSGCFGVFPFPLIFSYIAGFTKCNI